MTLYTSVEHLFTAPDGTALSPAQMPDHTYRVHDTTVQVQTSQTDDEADTYAAVTFTHVVSAL